MLCIYNCLISLIVTEIREGLVLGGVGNRGLSPTRITILISILILIIINYCSNCII